MAKSRSHEAGFVLIGAIWLLVLAGTIAAALLLRSLTVSRQAASESAELAERLALDGAAETAFASLLLDGPRSPWAARAENEVRVGGRSFVVAVSAENGRLDANSADPAILAAALQGMGVAADRRERIIAGLTARRGAPGRDIRNAQELRAMLTAAGAGGPCLADLFTLYSRLERPSPAAMPPRLAAALGTAGSSAAGVGAGLSAAGGALRVEAASPRGGALTVVARLTGLSDAPVTIHRWEYRRDCAPMGSVPAR